MSTQVRDPFLAVTIDTTGSTHYRVDHENLTNASYTRLPTPEEDGKFVVPYDLPNVPSTYTVSVQTKNSLHESAVVSESVILMSDVVSTVSTKRNLLRIAQSFGSNVTPTTMCDGIKCFHSFISLYNNSDTEIDLSTVKLWTRYQNATSEPSYDVDGITLLEYNTLPDNPVVLTNWASVTLSGTIAPNGYFLILGPRVPTENIQAGTEAIEQIVFTTGIEDTTNYHVDLDLSASTDFWVSSKYTEIFLSDAALTTVPELLYNQGALCESFIDLYGTTSDKSSEVEENYEVPECILTYFNGNSKHYIKTIVDPTIEAASNLTDYTSVSIKKLSSAAIRITPTCRPRNSNFTGEYV